MILPTDSKPFSDHLDEVSGVTQDTSPETQPELLGNLSSSLQNRPSDLDLSSEDHDNELGKLGY